MQYIRLTSADAQRYWNLLNALDYETEFMLYEPGERSADLTCVQGLLADAQAHPGDTLVLAAEADGELVGFVSASRGGHRRTAHSAYVVCGVRKAFRRQGIGTELMLRLDGWARECRIHRLELAVLCENTIAVHMYRKIGFAVDGRRRHAVKVNGVYKDEYGMAKLYPEEV